MSLDLSSIFDTNFAKRKTFKGPAIQIKNVSTQ